MKQSEFIEKAIKKHGNKYDYSKVEYINNKTKVCIICNRCGAEFYVRPNDFLIKSGCINCRKYHEKEYYTKIFKWVHGNKYDYSLMNDKKIYTRDDIITILCPIHGEFEQRISNHVEGKGCQKCGLDKCKKSAKIDILEVAQRFQDICGDKFTYDLTEYVNTQIAVTLQCNKCGKTFKRDLNALTYNNTCPHCNGKARNMKYTTEEYIERATKVHNGKYDYSKLEYKSSDEKVCVICHEKDIFGEEHGEFWLAAKAHIGKHKIGCPKCSGKYHYTNEEFIRLANYLHDDFYDYSKTNYVAALTPIIITCPIHGDFKQKPNGHLMGQGCPICKQSHYERNMRKFLKDNNIEFISQYKPKWLSPMSLDFYLPEYNVGIEVQGEQHFKEVKYWGGASTLEKVKTRDAKKMELCKENNINLLYFAEKTYDFPYEVFTDKQKLLEKIKTFTTFAIETTDDHVIGLDD